MATRAQVQATVNGGLVSMVEVETSLSNLRAVFQRVKNAIDYENSIDPQTWNQARVDQIVAIYTPIYDAAKADVVAKFNLLP